MSKRLEEFIRVLKYIKGWTTAEVAKEFVPNPENKKYVNHKNGFKDDNRAINLEWVTFSENMIHGFENGLYNQIGQKNNNAILTEGKAMLIKTLCQKYSTDDILEILNIPKEKRHLVANIKCGRLWKHLTI